MFFYTSLCILIFFFLISSSPKEALNGTKVLNTLALDKGADIIRVHDVKEALECKNQLHFHFDWQSKHRSKHQLLQKQSAE